MKPTVVLLSLVACAGLSGCVIPYRYTTRIRAKATVVDARTSRPIAAADIKLAQPANQTSIRSSPDGTFVIPAQKEWGAYIFPMESFPRPTPVVVSHPGYTAATRAVSAPGDDGARGVGGIVDIGAIPLTPTAR